MENKKQKFGENNKERYNLIVDSFIENKELNRKRDKFFKKHRFINVYLILCVPFYIVLIYASNKFFEVRDSYFSLYVSIVIFVLVYESLKFKIMNNKKISREEVVNEILKQNPIAEFGFETTKYRIYSTELIVGGDDVIVEFSTPKTTIPTEIKLDAELMVEWKKYITNFF